ncbi:MAG TPA: hypothetical protein VIY48_00500, partial [Candidatus Paceibacterota bacterium]
YYTSMASHGGGFDFSKNKGKEIWKKMLLSWTHGGAEYINGWLKGWAFEPIVVMPILFLLVVWVAYALDPMAIEATFAVIVALSPIWLPYALLIAFWHQWMHYIRFRFWFSPGNRPVLLEITLPPEVEKSPLAMEIFLVSLHQGGGETTFLHRIWKGQMRMSSALEIASNHGQIRYYIHTRAGWRNIVESRLYGQFPEAQVREVDDYTRQIPSNLAGYNVWGTEYQKSDPGALPIKTYQDFNLDKDPDKPEVQTDPLSQILELMGSIGPDEHMWVQFIIRARKKDEWYGFYLNADKYMDGAKKVISDITSGAVKRAQDLVSTDDPAEDKKQKAQAASRGATLMSEMERRKVEAIERSMSKPLFEVGIRTIYAAKPDRFMGLNVSSLVTFFAPFRGVGKQTNSLGVTRGNSIFDYPWQDWNGIRDNIQKHNMLFRYRHRAYFGVPYDQVPIFMTTEELATIWHFPSSAIRTPALSRVSAKVSEAPINLPTADTLPR